MRKIIFISSLLVLVFGSMVIASSAKAAGGDIYVDIKDELGTDLSGATLYYYCTGGVEQSCGDGAACDLDTTADIMVTPVTEASCDASDTINAKVEKDGYVTNSTLGYGTYSTTAQNGGAASMLFAHKVTGQQELGGSLTGATVTVGGTACTESSGVYYCPTVLASDGGTNDVIVTKDGYVTWTANSTDRTANSNAQATYTSANKFAYKITSIKSETPTDITSSVSALTVGNAAGKNSCTISDGAWYCPVVLANSDGTLAGNVTATGYVTGDYNLVTGTTRTANTDPQRSDTITGVLLDYKITVYKMDGTTAFSGVTVTIYTANDYTTIADNLDATGANDASGTTDSSGIKKFALAPGTYYYKVEYTDYVTEGSSADVRPAGGASVSSGSLTTNTETMFTLVLNISVVDPGVGNALNIYWSNPSDTVGFHHIHIYRSINSGVLGTKILDNWTTPTIYTDRNLLTGRTYYYTLRTVRSDDVESTDVTQYSKAPTGAAGADVTPPSSPNDVKVVDPTTGGTLNLSWTNPPEADFSHICIYRSTTTGVLGNLVYDKVVGTSKTDTGLTNDVTYYYTLRSVDKLGNESSNIDQYSGTPTLAVIPEEEVVPPEEEVVPPEEEVVPPVEKPIAEMTVEEIKAKIVEIQQKIIELLQQLIQLIQTQIQELLK